MRGRRSWLAGCARLPGGVLTVLLLLGAAAPVGAEGWGGVIPGETVRREVEARLGRPSRERIVIEEGRSVPEWSYLGAQAPRGLDRLVVSFGLLRRGAFAADVVRSLALYPKPHVFSLQAILNGWGKPDAIGTQEHSGRPAFRYDSRGLLIVLDKSGGWAEELLFAPSP